MTDNISLPQGINITARDTTGDSRHPNPTPLRANTKFAITGPSGLQAPAPSLGTRLALSKLCNQVWWHNGRYYLPSEYGCESDIPWN